MKSWFSMIGWLVFAGLAQLSKMMVWNMTYWGPGAEGAFIIVYGTLVVMLVVGMVNFFKCLVKVIG